MGIDHNIVLFLPLRGAANSSQDTMSTKKSITPKIRAPRNSATLVTPEVSPYDRYPKRRLSPPEFYADDKYKKGKDKEKDKKGDGYDRGGKRRRKQHEQQQKPPKHVLIESSPSQQPPTIASVTDRRQEQQQDDIDATSLTAITVNNNTRNEKRNVGDMIRDLLYKDIATTNESTSNDAVGEIVNALKKLWGLTDIRSEGERLVTREQDANANRRTAYELGGHAILLLTMDRYKEHSTIQGYACMCLFTMSFADENDVAIVKAGGIDAICEAMRTNVQSSLVQECGLGALMNLLSRAGAGTHEAVDVAADKFVYHHKGVELIGRAMENFQDHINVQAHGCRILHNLLIHTDKYKPQLMSVLGAVGMALQKHGEFSMNKQEKEENQRKKKGKKKKNKENGWNDVTKYGSCFMKEMFP